jgi:hypothetical protein
MAQPRVTVRYAVQKKGSNAHIPTSMGAQPQARAFGSLILFDMRGTGPLDPMARWGRSDGRSAIEVFS